MRHELPFVSVIIPVFNDPQGLSKVLEAVIGQTYPRTRYEVIVVDNNSTDATPRVIDEYSTRYPELVYPQTEDRTQGSYAARNRGVKAARGTIIVFTDADCVPVNTWLEAGIQQLQQYQAAFGAGQIRFTFQAEEPTVWEYLDAANKLDQKTYVEKAGFGATANLFVRHEMFGQYGFFREDLRSGGDYEFGRRLTEGGEKLIYIEEALVYHPARASYREKINKSKRVTEGQAQLAELGLLKHGTLTWHRLIPVTRCPELQGISLGPFKRIGVILAANLLRYQNLIRRLV